MSSNLPPSLLQATLFDLSQQESSGPTPTTRAFSETLHKGFNEAGNNISIPGSLTSPWYDRYTGPRMYEHSATGALREGMGHLAAGMGVGGTPGGAGSSTHGPIPGAPTPPAPNWIRTRPRAGTVLGPAGPGMAPTPANGLGAMGTPSALPPGAPQLALPPGPPRAGSGMPATAIPPSRPSAAVSSQTPAQQARSRSRSTPNGPRGHMTRAERSDPGKQAMGMALKRSLGDIVPPKGERPFWDR